MKKKQARKGFTQVYNAFLDSDRLTQYDKMVFIAIKSFADSKTKKAFPSLATISRISGVSISQVRRCIENLKKLGVVKVEHRRDEYSNSKMSNLYTLYDSPDMWAEERVSEDDDFRAAAEELPDHILREEFERRFRRNEKEFGTEPTKAQYQTPYKNQYSKDNNIMEKAERQEPYSLEEIKEYYDYDTMVSDHPQEKNQIDYVMQILYDTINSSSETIRVQKTERPKSVVVGVLMKLTYSEIMYVIEKYKAQTDRITYPKAYLLTQLYEAKGQLDADITNQVQHDIYGDNEDGVV